MGLQYVLFTEGFRQFRDQQCKAWENRQVRVVSEDLCLESSPVFRSTHAQIMSGSAFHVPCVFSTSFPNPIHHYLEVYRMAVKFLTLKVLACGRLGKK